MSPRQVVQKVANVLTILAFFAALWLVWAARLLHRGESPCPNENRLLAAAPDFRATPFAELPKKIEAYVQDHLPYRAEFIKCHTFLKHWCLGLRSESVVIGKDGFLFYDRDGCQTLDYMGQAPLTAEQLALWKLYLERRQAYLAARSCRYLFVIAPNAASVYPEKLPDHIAANQGTTRREQLLRYLAEQSSTVEILDLVPALRDAKRLGPTFYRADSHWSGFGCQVALQEICASARLVSGSSTAAPEHPLRSQGYAGTHFLVVHAARLRTAHRPSAGIHLGPLPTAGLPADGCRSSRRLVATGSGALVGAHHDRQERPRTPSAGTGRFFYGGWRQPHERAAPGGLFPTCPVSRELQSGSNPAKPVGIHCLPGAAGRGD